MSVVFNAPIGASGSGATGNERSVRLRASANAYFSRTFGTPTDNKKWTLSMWIRRTRADNSIENIFTTANETIRFNDDAPGNQIRFVIAGGTVRPVIQYRDPSEWFMLTVAFDSTQATDSNRIKIYKENNWQTSFTSATWPALNATSHINSAVAHFFGTYSSSQYLDGYLTEVYFIDGQALTPSSFGQLDSNNIWVPKAYTGTYGNNGFYLNFRDTSAATAAAIGKDSSGNGNNWTPNNISVTAGATYDSMYDYPVNAASGTQPVGNYATLNPLYPSAANISYGNLRSGTTAVRAGVNANTGIGHYWEVTAGASTVTAGVVDDSTNTNTTTVTANKVFGFRLTAAGALDYINITDAGSWTSITTGLTGNRYPYGTTAAADWNFGQRPFSGTPSGYSLCTANLPTPAILNPSEHHYVATVDRSVSSSFTLPWDANTYDTLFWIKKRTATGTTDWYQIDGLRGYDKVLSSNSWAVETTDANVITVSGTTITLGSTLTASATYVVYCWKAGLSASRQTNTDGSITSTVSRNVTAGFSIATYSGNSIAGATVGHGLGAAPKFVVTMMRTGGTENRACWHGGLSGGTYYINLNSTAAQVNDNARFYATPSSSVLTFGGNSQVSATGYTYVAYCWAEIDGYSKFGSYTTNNVTDGPNAFLNHKPRTFLAKNASGVFDWVINDSARLGYNGGNSGIYPNGSYAEDSTQRFDLLSNGIKVRNNNGIENGTAGSTEMFASWADQPFALNPRAR